MITTGTVFLYKYVAYQYTKLKKMEGAIKNGQSRDTGNIGHTRHKTKTKKKKTKDKTEN
jgi:hypothetical protein